MLKECFNCGSTNLGDRWTAGRLLEQHCYECGWTAQPRIPEKLPIVVVKQVKVNQFWGFHYEVFDRYGHMMVSSRYYDKEDEAETALNKELERGKKDFNAGPYTAVLWPARTLVEGRVFK